MKHSKTCLRQDIESGEKAKNFRKRTEPMKVNNFAPPAGKDTMKINSGALTATAEFCYGTRTTEGGEVGWVGNAWDFDALQNGVKVEKILKHGRNASRVGTEGSFSEKEGQIGWRRKETECNKSAT